MKAVGLTSLFANLSSFPFLCAKLRSSDIRLSHSWVSPLGQQFENYQLVSP